MKRVVNYNEGHFPALYITRKPFVFYAAVRVLGKPLRITIRNDIWFGTRRSKL